MIINQGVNLSHDCILMLSNYVDALQKPEKQIYDESIHSTVLHQRAERVARTHFNRVCVRLCVCMHARGVCVCTREVCARVTVLYV